jgi:hypothetical protein
MTITHVHPRTGAPWEEQTPIGNGLTEIEVWNDIRLRTLMDEDVLFVETHQYAKDEMIEQLEIGQFDRSRVQILSLDPVTKTIHIPSRTDHMRHELVRASDGKVLGVLDVPEQPATTKEIVVERYLNFGTVQNARHIAKKAKECHAKLVVVWEPHVEAGDLDYLSEVKDADVVIFHLPSEKYGVVVEGEVDPDNWEDEFPALSDLIFHPPKVIAEDLLIKGNIHVLAGRFEAYKTMELIEVSDAVLSERPAFDHFKICKSHPILFLCADMSPELFSDYAAPFNLRKHGDAFRVMNPKGSIVHAIDSPVMQRAVKGRIVILDTMLDFANIKEAFQSGEWITFMHKLRELITVHGGIAVIMTAHATKTGAKSNTIDPSEYLKDSVTFGGKIDVGIAFSRLENTSQIFVERIKSRGFKKPLSFTIAVNDDDGNCNFDRGRFPVYLKPGEAGKKEDHTPQSGRKPNPKKDEQTQLILQLRREGKTFSEIANTVGIPESTARAYYHANEWDKNKGEQ